jgi:D-beta-D-heptose 7-phosphate kinase/D-beta-D-heptose 1-phosphate adenosyltransferase
MKKILVIGESCKDIFVYCGANRLCPDMPVPVLDVINCVENPGMAMNVHRNIKKLIDDCDIITNNDWESITKTRYMHNDTNHMFIRIDSDHSKIQQIDIKNVNLNDYELIAISDYNKGFLTDNDIEYIFNNHNNVFIDTKKIIGDWAKNAKFIKINITEYKRSKDKISETLMKKLIYTKGSEGCYFNNKNYPVNRVEIKDSSGAGDSFFAALVCNYLNTNNIEKSIIFANKCASEVVKHRGVTTI